MLPTQCCCAYEASANVCVCVCVRACVCVCVCGVCVVCVCGTKFLTYFSTYMVARVYNRLVVSNCPIGCEK